MPVIELSTVIRAPRERVFDLARSIDAHQDSTGGTGERAVAGVTKGLIGMNEEVTWGSSALRSAAKAHCSSYCIRPSQALSGRYDCRGI
jgi:hypothetical protein